MKTLFLDFDGVLFDTLKEAYILCRYAYSGTDYFTVVDDIEYKKFYRYKFLVYNSWQYYYLMKLLKENLSDEDFITKYESYMKNRNFESEKQFDIKYYAARDDLMKNHSEYWKSLERPFKFFDYIKLWVSDKKINPIIVSKKNKKAIEYRCEQYGLFMPSDNIFGKDELSEYDTKADFIHEYILTNKIESAYFIDDNSNNLKPCENYPEIIPLLAGWGNIKIGEIGLTEEEIADKL